MKQKGYWIAGILIIVLIIVLSSGSFFNLHNQEDDHYRTVSVVRRDIHATVLATGIIKPKVGAEVRVGSRVSGIVKKLYANIGNVVQKGQLIAELDPTELQAKYNQAKATLNNARANYQYAKLDMKRKKSLLDKNLISTNQFDLAEKSFEINKAQLDQAKANLAYAQTQLDYTRIRAPITGVVASVSTQEGETVAANFSAPTFVNIIDLNRLEVWAYVDETDIGRICKGQKTTFRVDTFMDTDFEGTITAIYPKAVIQDNVVNYIATIDIDDFKNKVLRPEMTTTVTINLETRKNVLSVPTVALKRVQNNMMATVLENKQKLPQPVKIGWSSGGYTEIIDGLNEGSRIVIP